MQLFHSLCETLRSGTEREILPWICGGRTIISPGQNAHRGRFSRFHRGQPLPLAPLFLHEFHYNWISLPHSLHVPKTPDDENHREYGFENREVGIPIRATELPLAGIRGRALFSGVLNCM